MGQHLRRKGRDKRITVSRRGPDCHQRVHVRSTAQQCRNTLAEKTQPRSEQHQRGQHELDVPVGLLTDDCHHPMMQGGDQVRAHLQNEHRQAEDGGNQQGALQPPRLALAPLVVLLTRIRGIGGHTAGRVPRALDGGLKVGSADSPGQMNHLRALGGQIDTGLTHAGHLRQRLLDPAHTRGTGHAFDCQLGGFFRHRVARALDGIYHRLRIGRSAEGNIGALGGQIDRGQLHARYRLERTFDPTDARGARHAFNRQTQTRPHSAGCFGLRLKRNASHWQFSLKLSRS